jgi:hypothetical protein
MILLVQSTIVIFSERSTAVIFSNQSMAVIFSDDLTIENDFANRDLASLFPVRSMTQISPRTNGLDLIAISCFSISEVRAPPLF